MPRKHLQTTVGLCTSRRCFDGTGVGSTDLLHTCRVHLEKFCLHYQLLQLAAAMASHGERAWPILDNSFKPRSKSAQLTTLHA
jgi:hypothetical protein